MPSFGFFTLYCGNPHKKPCIEHGFLLFRGKYVIHTLHMNILSNEHYLYILYLSRILSAIIAINSEFVGFPRPP